MFKNAKVILILDVHRSQSRLNSDRIHLIFKEGKFFNPFKNEYYDMYITTEDKIEGNTYYVLDNNIVSLTSDIIHDPKFYKRNCRKIISTTDDKKSINLGKEYHPYPTEGGLVCTRLCPFPKPSDSFIKKFIESYNQGKPIVDIQVEYDKIVVPGGSVDCMDEDDIDDTTYIYKVRVDKNNEITIKEIKDSWNREEVIKLIKSSQNIPIIIENQLTERRTTCRKWEFDNQDNWFDNWIEQNL